MKILVTGARGLIGAHLCCELIRRGHQLHIFSRSDSPALPGLPCRQFVWNKGKPPAEALKQIDGVVNLMGEPLFGSFFRTNREKEISFSRIDRTKMLTEALKEHNPKLKSYVGASAIGYYDYGEQEIKEGCPAGDHHLSKLCYRWEQAHKSMRDSVDHFSIIRIGLVLGAQASFIKMLTILGLLRFMPKPGFNNPWMSWIHIADLVAILADSAEGKVSGVFNGTAPHPVRQDHFYQVIKKYFGSCLSMKIPEWCIRMLTGKSSSAICGSQKVLPGHLVHRNYPFIYSDIEEALRTCFPKIIVPRSSKSKPCMVLKYDQFLPVDKKTAWVFFRDPYNLEQITPAILQFCIKHASDNPIKEGTEISYSLKLHGIPVNWDTRILTVDPEKKFVDFQNKGPYRIWHHTHEFEEVPGGTLMTDEIKFQLKFNPYGLFLLPFIMKDLNKIFVYRRSYIESFFTNKMQQTPKKLVEAMQ